MTLTGLLLGGLALALALPTLRDFILAAYDWCDAASDEPRLHDVNERLRAVAKVQVGGAQ